MAKREHAEFSAKLESVIKQLETETGLYIPHTDREVKMGGQKGKGIGIIFTKLPKEKQPAGATGKRGAKWHYSVHAENYAPEWAVIAIKDVSNGIRDIAAARLRAAFANTLLPAGYKVSGSPGEFKLTRNGKLVGIFKQMSRALIAVDSEAWEDKKLREMDATGTSKLTRPETDDEPDKLTREGTQESESYEGKESERSVLGRDDQEKFRRAVLSAYGGKCCITGLNVPELLNASHIVPWSKNPEQRLNPRNGLCLNALHDRAFDRGLITVLPNGKVKVSAYLREKAKTCCESAFLIGCDGKKIAAPELDKFKPAAEFLKRHNRKFSG